MNRKLFSLVKNRSGQSLISVIVAAGVGAIVMGFLTDMLIQQGIGQKFISQKLEINDLTNNIISTFSKSSNCTCQFAAADNPNAINYADLKFDSNDNSGNQFINIKKLYSGCAGVGPLALAEEGQLLSPSSSLRVNTVKLINLRRASSLTEWQGQWEISFQYGAGSAIRSVKPVLVTQKFTIDNGASANARITVCNGLSTGTGTQDHLAKWSPTPGVIQDSGVVEDTVTGNVGIGTTNPGVALPGWTPDVNQTILEISGAGGPSVFSSGVLVLSNNRATATAGDQNGALVFSHRTNPAPGVMTQPAVIQSQLEGTGVLGGLGANLQFHTKQDNSTLTEKMRITPNGFVGIGTSAPENRLHVLGGSTMENSYELAVDYPLVMRRGRGTQTAPAVVQNGDRLGGLSSRPFDGTTWRETALISSIVNGTVTAGASVPTDLTFWTGSAAAGERMRILSNGNVGIGTIAPNAKLEVAGTFKPGSITMPSACTELGAQGYNSVTGAPVYCNGTNWVRVGGIDTCTIRTATAVNTATASCLAGEQLTGGGCYSVPETGYFRANYPNSSSTFLCWDITSQTVTAAAICCK